MTADDAYEVYRDSRPPQAAKLYPVRRSVYWRAVALQAALKRRKIRDVAWFMQTGTPPPVRKQRSRWFRDALKKYERLGIYINLTHVQKTLLYAMR